MLDPAESPIAHRDRTHGNLTLVSRPFILILAIMVMVAAASLDLLSSIRAYVGGEGLYSKGQKDAVYYLARYARSRTESDYDRYAAAIAVPLGDRDARLALQSSPVEINHARAGFLAGGNDPADVRGMIWLFRCCSTVAPMNSAVAIWTAADSYNARIDGIALSLRTATSLDSSPDQVSRAVADLDEINSRLGPLENQFSQLLGGLARLARTVLIFFLGISGIALGLIAARAARIRLAERRHYELALKASEERYRSVFKASADAVLILGRDGTVLAANPAARRLFADGADTVSTRDFELHSDTLALPQPGAAGEFRRDMQFSRRDGELFIGEASYVSFIDSNGE